MAQHIISVLTNRRRTAKFYSRKIWKTQIYYAEEPTAEIVAFHAGTRLPPIVLKKHKNWTAVYVAGSIGRALTVDFWRMLARRAALVPYGPAGDITAAGNGIIMIHAVTPGMKKLAWTENADVVDLVHGKVIRQNARDLSISMAFGETRWFSLVRSK